MSLDNLHRHPISFLQLIFLINWLLPQIGRFVFYKFDILYLTSKRPLNRAGLLFNPLSATNASSEVRLIINIIDDWCSTCQYWISSFLTLCLKYRFFTAKSIYLLFFCYLLFTIVIIVDLRSRYNTHKSRNTA